MSFQYNLSFHFLITFSLHFISFQFISNILFPQQTIVICTINNFLKLKTHWRSLLNNSQSIFSKFVHDGLFVVHCYFLVDQIDLILINGDADDVSKPFQGLGCLYNARNSSRCVLNSTNQLLSFARN